MKITEAYHHSGTWYCLPTGKWPERPNHCSQNAPRCEVNGYQHCDCADEEHNYETALAAALKEAVPFKDKEQIGRIALGNIDKQKHLSSTIADPCLYVIPPTEVEIESTCKCEGDLSLPCVLNSSYCEREQVARIVTPTSEREKPVEEKEGGYFKKLEQEFNRYRNSIFTTESSAPVMSDFLWFKQKLGDQQSTIAQLQEENERLKIRENNYLFLQREKDSTIKELVEALEEANGLLWGLGHLEVRKRFNELISKVKSKLSTEEPVNVSICPACKRFWIMPVNACTCGQPSYFFESTHPSNAAFAENTTKFNLPAACVFQLQQIALADDDMVKLPGAAENYRYIARHILELFTITRKS